MGARQGRGRPEAAAPARQSHRPHAAGQASVRPQVLTPAMRTRVHGFYARGCISRRGRAADGRRHSQVMRLSRNRMWGNPDLIALIERLPAKANSGGGLDRHPGRRHVPAARRPDVDRPRHPSGRPRRGRLADPDAEPALSRDERETMSAVTWYVATGSVRSARLDAVAGSRDPRRGGGADRRAHLRQRRDQEGALRDREGRSPWIHKVRPITATTTTSTSASNARPAPATARASPNRTKARAAAPAISPTGSAMQCCIRSRRKYRRNRNRR